MSQAEKPQGPSLTLKSFPAPGPGFQRAARRVVWNVAFFITTYLLLASLGIGIGLGMVALGVYIGIAVPFPFTFLLAVLLAAVGGTLVWFLVRTFFLGKALEPEGLIELTEEEEPELFSVIRDIAQQVGTGMPRRVCLTWRVEAAAVVVGTDLKYLFMDSPKDLHIGLGLVDALTVGELRAVLAHEFGHFSQRSLRIATYVYRVNAVIHRMMNDVEPVEKVFKKVLSLNPMISWPASLLARVINMFQYVVSQLHRPVVKSYMALSREMEYHADAVSATVEAPPQAASALYRTEMASFVQGFVAGWLANRRGEGKRVDNLYALLPAMRVRFAKDYSVPLQDGWPMLDAMTSNYYQQSRIHVSRTWESHPPNRVRAAKMAKAKGDAAWNEAAAWSLFAQPRKWQEAVSLAAYGEDAEAQELMVWPAPEALAEMEGHHVRRSMPSEFHGYYDRHLPDMKAMSEVDRILPKTVPLAELFVAEHASLPHQLEVVERDMELCKAMQAGKIEVRQFEFEGLQYSRSQLPDVVNRLSREKLKLTETLWEWDVRVCKQARMAARQQGREPDLLEAWAKIMEQEKQLDMAIQLLEQLQDAWKLVVNGATITEQWLFSMLRQFHPREEVFIGLLNKWLDTRPETWGVESHHMSTVHKYLASPKVYFEHNQVQMERVELLHQAMHAFDSIVSLKRRMDISSALNVQLDILRSTTQDELSSP